MDEDLLLWSAGRDLALLRRAANPQISQTETFNNTTLFRRLFLEGMIHNYWKHLRPNDKVKFSIEYSSVQTKGIEAGQSYLLVLTGDQWSDLLLGGISDSKELLYDVHGGLRVGPLANHFKSSVILAHDQYAFTASDLIKYHAYVLGEVHLGPKEQSRVEAYDQMLLSGQAKYPIQFGNNGPSSLALKGFLNRVTRSEAFKHMFSDLYERGYIPEDIQYPAAIEDNDLLENIQEYGYNTGVISLRWTQRATEQNIPGAFSHLVA